ncbi:MAG: hypothetical protein AAGM38_07600 [Pseudomonadota bacterium]
MMRTLALCGVLAALIAGCASAPSTKRADPPDWFLRQDEQAALEASRAEAEAAAESGPSLRFSAPTDQPLPLFADRLGDVVERCWVGGEPGWRVERGRASVAMVQTQRVGRTAGAQPRTMLSLTTKPGRSVGLEVLATGPLARPPYRPRIARAIDRAKGAGPIQCGDLAPS